MCCNGEIIDKREFQYEHFGDLIVYLALFGVPIEEYVTDQLPEKYGLLSCVDCCGKTAYFASADKICCGQTLYQKPANAECCGREPIDSVVTICCEGVAQPRPPNGACCGQKAYDRKRQYCCSGEIKDIDEPQSLTDFQPISKTDVFISKNARVFVNNQLHRGFCL